LSDSLIDKILGYVDAPWKILSITILAVVGVICVSVWERRAEIAEMVLHRTVLPRLEPGEFSKVVPPLMEETGVDVAILMQTELSHNLNRIVVGILRDNPGWKPSPAPRSIFTDGDPEAFVWLLEGATVCRDITASDPSQTAREMAAIGIKRGCIVAVPPILDVLVGALGIGWKAPLNGQAEAGAKAALRRAALKLATW
jgi:hypothetical protein